HLWSRYLPPTHGPDRIGTVRCPRLTRSRAHFRPSPPRFRRMLSRSCLSLVAVFLALSPARADEAKPAPPAKVSYYKQVRPVFQAYCQGCHQPAKDRGGYVMTAFDKLLAGGESGEPAVVAKKADESQLIELITPK